MNLPWSLYGTMKVITKGADASRRDVFMFLVNVLRALVIWWSESLFGLLT